MERLNRLIDLFKTLDNAYVVNELLLIKKDIEELNKQCFTNG